MKHTTCDNCTIRTNCDFTHRECRLKPGEVYAARPDLIRPHFVATGDDVKHGTVSAYTTYGCRCGQCRDAKAEYRAEYAAKVRYGKVERKKPLKHGTEYAYTVWRCRCGECSKAGKMVMQRIQQARNARRLDLEM